MAIASIFDSSPILGKQRSSFLPLPAISTNPSAWPTITVAGAPLRRSRSYRTQSKNITSLETSFSPQGTLRKLRNHKWSGYDGMYIILAIVGIFALSIIESPGPLVKTLLASLILLSLVIPVTGQFFLPFLPPLTWLVLFYASRFVPAAWRPSISVRVLPALENILYGANLSNILATHTSVVLDVLAWLPYGIGHYSAPFVCAIVLFIFGPPGTVPVFARTFGYMNLIGEVIHIVFPCSPPWYEMMYGLAPADYSMNGSPGGLARIDTLFGSNTYTSTFNASPMVFGAFPSLHAGSATVEALFLIHVFPKATPFFLAYVMLLWWATMYLTHHYFVDLIGGSCLAVATFYIAERKFLPRIQPGKMFRWNYTEVQRGSYDRRSSSSTRRVGRSRANSAAAVAGWQSDPFIDIERGYAGLPGDVEDEQSWELNDIPPLNPPDDDADEAHGSISPSTEGSSAALDSIWDGSPESDGDITNATTLRSPTDEDDYGITIKVKG